MAYVRPQAASFATSFVSAGRSVVLQLYVPIVVGRAIDLIIGMGRVDFAAGTGGWSSLPGSACRFCPARVQGYCDNLLTNRCVEQARGR